MIYMKAADTTLKTEDGKFLVTALCGLPTRRPEDLSTDIIQINCPRCIDIVDDAIDNAVDQMIKQMDNSRIRRRKGSQY